MEKVIQAVPNFSEGINKDIYEKILDVFRNKKGVKLIDSFPDADFNRTVVTALGSPGPLKEALLEMTGLSVKLINMERQSGAHPRIGAQDTIPIFPLRNIGLDECVRLAEEIGEEVYKRFNVPVYFSGENARRPERKSLSLIRKGGYEGLKGVAHTEERKPDLGPAKLHPTAGATIVSAGTLPLVAYNVILGTNDVEIAKKISKVVRAPSGGFVSIRSIGMKFEKEGLVCVSMNVFNHGETPLYRLYELIKIEAERHNVPVVRSQLVGVVPLDSLLSSLTYYLKLDDFKRSQILEEHLIDF